MIFLIVMIFIVVIWWTIEKALEEKNGNHRH